MTTTGGSICRSCNAPIVWQDTEAGRRPFNPDGRLHFTTCTEPRQRKASNGAVVNPAKHRAIARMSALRSAAIYCGHRSAVDESVKSEHIFVLAERMLAWLEKGDG